MLEKQLQLVPVFVLVVTRLGAMLMQAPVLNSPKVPARVRGLMLLVLAMGMTPMVKTPAHIPQSLGEVALSLGGEILFGYAMGMSLMLVFVAGQWAGEMIGQQMGLNMSETFDPQFGARGSLVGELYFMLTTVIFLTIGGHRILLRAVGASFDVLPLGSVHVDAQILELLVSLAGSCTILAFKLMSPVLLTMMLSDVAVGFLSRTIPQLNVMTAGVTIRTMAGLLILVVGISMTGSVIQNALLDGLQDAWDGWTTLGQAMMGR